MNHIYGLDGAEKGIRELRQAPSGQFSSTDIDRLCLRIHGEVRGMTRVKGWQVQIQKSAHSPR